MRVNTNVSALVVQENSNLNNIRITNSLEKLSTGLKINKASDDASGLSIAEKLRTQVTSLNQGIDNGNSAISLLQIADKSMAEQSKILDIVKSKLVQANTDTTSDDGREAIRKDIQKLLQQLDNIAQQTNYNGTKLLEPSLKTINSTTSSVSSSSSSSSKTNTLSTQTLTAGDSYNGLVNEATSYDITFTSANYFASIVSLSGTGGKLITNTTNNYGLSTTDVATQNFLSSLGGDVFDWGGGVYTISNGYDIDFGNNSFVIAEIAGGTATSSYSYSGGVLTSLSNSALSTVDITISGTYTTASSTSSSTSTTSSSVTTVSSGLSFQIGESSGDLINNFSIQSNTLGLGGGSEAIDQTTGSSTRNNLMSVGESMIFSIGGDGNSATIDATDGSATNVNLSGDVNTINLTGTSGTISNLDETTYDLLNALSMDIDGVNNSETLNGVTVTLSSGTTITKSGGGFTISQGSISFSDDYSIASMNIKETTASGTISVQNANNLLVTNLSDSATVSVTSNASGTLVGGQTLAALKNLQAGQFTQQMAHRFQGVVDSAISRLNTYRSDIGSTQNQVESAVRNLMTQSTNVAAAESIIRDVDYAEESSNFNKLNVISQAGSYAMSQAFATSQNVLRLFS
ncbi:flagellin [Arcobacter sp.]|uniref:flagellin N-terminal helical domain-containing protein n=1 Tax=Arcobacter sp. TaxID=1872629 RepID=UPI003D0EC076